MNEYVKDYELRESLKDLFDILEGWQYEGLSDAGHRPAVIVCRNDHNENEMREILNTLKEFLEGDSWFKGELHVGESKMVIE